MIMKTFYTIVLLCLVLFSSSKAQVGINNDGSLPDPSAILDVKSSTQGFLPPRVSLIAANSAVPVISPAIGLLVYNTAFSGPSPNNVMPGYYYWNGTRWISVAPSQGTNPGDMLYWNGTQWAVLPAGSNGQSLVMNNGVPTWWGQYSAQLPSVATDIVSDIYFDHASSGGCLLDGGAAIFAKGLCWSTSPNPTTANNKTYNGIGPDCFYNVIMTGLTQNTTYYVRAYATNSVGTGYGNEYIFNTLNGNIGLTTMPISNISAHDATGGGNIVSGQFIDQKGVCWSTSANPTISDSHTLDGYGQSSYSSILTNLLSSTTYFVRAYASNYSGTYYGNEVSFTTPDWFCEDSITDSRDGKIYHTKLIGTQCWMTQNLNVGTMINSNIYETNNGSIEKFCYGNSESYCNDYGGLYQWDEYMNYTTTSNTIPSLRQGICPIGWHIPSDAEWTVLTTYLGGENVAGGKMKEAGTMHWEYPNTGATNSSGFKALAGGYFDGVFKSRNYYAFYWSSTESNDINPWYRDLFYGSIFIERNSYYQKEYGMSGRCLKD
jgi:uncharacterized protein (TIGR02145 family)